MTDLSIRPSHKPIGRRVVATDAATRFSGENSGMSFDPYAPYGALRETTCRVATWNVWGRYGDWSARLDGIVAELKRSPPDIVCLEEAWTTPEENEGDLVGEALGLSHRFTLGGWPQDGWISGVAIVSVRALRAVGRVAHGRAWTASAKAAPSRHFLALPALTGHFSVMPARWESHAADHATQVESDSAGRR